MLYIKSLDLVIRKDKIFFIISEMLFCVSETDLNMRREWLNTVSLSKRDT
jgi:hypothetical protein